MIHSLRKRPITEWARAFLLAAVCLGSLGSSEAWGADDDATVKQAPRGILVEELSKETYNVLTELHAVLQSKAWDDAAKLIASVDPASARGLAPQFSDRTLLTSLPVAIQLAREDYPQLRQVISEKMGPLAKLRVTQAMSAGDAATLQLAAVQFAGTPAASEAHRWLGDRALMQGRFDKAIFEYQQAGGGGSPANEEIEPRIRLATAMMGHSAGTSVKQAVNFGDVSMSPTAFEALLTEMRNRRLSSSEVEPANVPSAVPPPGRFEAHVRSRLDGPVGERPQDDLGRRINQLRVSWADRQIATVVDGEMLYVTNRFQVAAYQLSSGERIWQSQPPPGPMQRAQEWGLIAMRPLIVGERIYVRLLYSPSSQLVCLDKSTGKLVWIGESRESEFLVSDPVVIDGQLVALSVLIQPDQQGALRWNVFDRRNGEIVRVQELVKLRSTWGVRACCEVSHVDDGIVVALGGAVLAVDSSGIVRWVRTQNVSSPDDDPRWVEQMFQRPIVRDGRLSVAQPGVRAVDCLDAVTGRQHWSAALSDVVGIIGIAGDALVVQTSKGVFGFDLAAGGTRWRLDVEELFRFHLIDDQHLLIASSERALGKKVGWQPRLTWVNPVDGKPVARTTVAGLIDADPRLGPLVPYKNRVFTFFGRGQQDATRDVIELIPTGDAERIP
jgi:outer membrane protein assembly factor BamB